MIWTPEEDHVLSNTSIDYDEIKARLPHRSQISIWARASRLGFKRDKRIIQRINSENQRKEEWSSLLQDKEFFDVVDGELLGDGCIFRKKVKNRDCHDYTYIGGSACKEYAEYVHGILSRKLNSSAKLRRKPPDKNNGFGGSKDFYSYSFTSVVFKSFYDRWYPKGSIKTSIPSDLKLNPTICLHWYLGDGSLDSSFRRRMFEIELHTQNFKFKYVEQLKTLLEKEVTIQLGTKNSKKMKSNGKIRRYKHLRIHGDHARKFLEYIGRCPIQSMNYKWREWGEPSQVQLDTMV